MKFKTDFLAEDYSELCWYQVRKTGILLSVLLAIAFGLMFSSLIGSLTLTAILICVLYPVIRAMVRLCITKRADRRFHAFNVSSELFLELSESGIIQHSNSGETELFWDDVYKVGESKSSYYVFITRRKAFYFPKRSFKTPEAEREFIKILRANISNEKLKLLKK